MQGQGLFLYKHFQTHILRYILCLTFPKSLLS